MMATANCHQYFAAAWQRLQLLQLPSITCSAGVLRRKPALGKPGGGGEVRYCLGEDPKTPSLRSWSGRAVTSGRGGGPRTLGGGLPPIAPPLARAGSDIWARRKPENPRT